MNSVLKDALRALRKGDGLTLTSLAMLPNVEDAFGTDDYRAIRRAIIGTIASEHDDKGVAALANALAVDTPDGLTLMERRERYIEQHRMSMRTLTNYEEYGATVIAQLLPVPLQPSPPGDAARDLALVEDVVQRAIRDGGLTDHARMKALESLSRLHDVPDESIGERERERVIALMDQMLQLASGVTRARVGDADFAIHQRLTEAGPVTEPRSAGAVS